MILLIDNYDSFSYNLYQLVGTINPDITVIRNDEKTIKEIEQMAPEAILLSPCHPQYLYNFPEFHSEPASTVHSV